MKWVSVYTQSPTSAVHFPHFATYSNPNREVTTYAQ